MKRKITFLLSALFALTLITQSFTAVGQNYTYVVTNSIAINDVVVLVNHNDTYELTGISTTSTKYGIGTSFQNGVPNATYPLTVVAGNQNGTFAFKNSSNSYLTWTSGNSLNVNSTLSNNTSWTVEFDNSNNATITNYVKDGSDSRILQWNNNSGQYRFACYKNGGQSAVRIYKRVEAKVATPKFSPVAGSYSSAQDVAISTTTNGATIYYTTDGNTPTTNSSVYSSAIHVDSDMTIKAFATKTGLTNSDVAEAAYSIVQAQNLTITSEHGTPTVTVNSSPVTPTNNVYSIPQGATVNLSVAAANGYAFTGWTVTSGGVNISNNSFTMPSNSVAITANYDAVVIDNITGSMVNTAIGNNTGYQSWSGVTVSGHTAVYAGNSNKNNPATNYIQLNTGNPKGIVTTTSGGYAKKVSVTFVNTSNSTSGRTITVYGKNEAYTGPADLYDANKRGTSLGTLTCGSSSSTEDLVISGNTNYQYIGLLAGDGALYLEPVTITWLPVDFYNITYQASYEINQVEIGTVEVSAESAVEGTTITIEATGKNHYHFNGWTVLDENSDEVELTGTNPATFTMPASDVEVDAEWEEDTKYDIKVDAESEDYILVNENEYAGETVTIQISDVPSGKFIDEVTVTKDGGGNVNDVTYTGQEGDYYNYTFTMPEDDVTVAVSFKDPEIFTVSYYVKGVLDDTEDVTEGNSATLPSTTSHVDIDGFSILGWSASSGSTNMVPTPYFPSDNVSLYAVLGVLSNTTLTMTYNTTNFPSAYAASDDYTLDGKSFNITQVYKNGTKLQFKASAGTIYNNANFGRITSIVIAYYTADNAGATQNRNFSIHAGTAKNPYNGDEITGVTTGDIVTFDLTKDNNDNNKEYTYFVLAKGANAGYLSSITIYYETNAAVGTVTEYTANNASLSENIPASQCVIVKENAILTFTGTNNGNASNLIIEDGGQLITTNPVAATFKKKITGAAKDVYGWYTISSPVHDGLNTTINAIPSSLTSVTYDMLAYDEVNHKWLNQKGSVAPNPVAAGFSNMETGRGYLYRSSGGELEFVGNTNVADVTRTLTYTAGAGDLAGFHLVGNPYSQNITLSNTTLLDNDDEAIVTQLSGYYVLSNSGSWGTKFTTEDIAPEQGFLVQITSDAKKIKFSKTSRAAKYHGDNIKFIVANNQYEDVTYALFDKAIGLNKIEHRNPDIPMLYINQNNEDFAIATMSDDVKSFNLSFKAKTTGQYKLTYKAEGDFSYLHIIDRLTGADVDMLLEGEYNFIGTPRDNENRFIVHLSYSPNYNEGSHDIFAFQSGNDIYVSGSGELQIFDITGRSVMTTTINGAETINIPAQGVYIFRLVGNEVKTQKIVVR